MRVFKNRLLKLMKPRREAYFNNFLDLKEKQPKEVIREQKALLDKMVLHAYQNVPFYQQLYNEAGLAGQLNAGIVEIEKLPILTKDLVRSNQLELIASTANRDELIFGKTGGSTGVPLEYYCDTMAYDKMWAASHFFYTLCGWQPGERILHFWGARQDTPAHRGLKIKLSEWLVSERTIAAYEYDEKTLNGWYQELLSYRPVVMQGYASILYALADFLSRAGKAVMPLKGVYSTAEVLYPFQREVIERVFQCKVYNQYGCREIPGIACECQSGNMHCLPTTSYVESLPSESEEPGRLVISSLTNWSMPFIRYELGDFGDLKEGACSCGMPLPMMDMAVGRSNDILKFANGRHIYPSYFVHLMDDITEIGEYQFKQIALDSMELSVVGDCPPHVVEKLQCLGEKITEELKLEKLDFNIHYVEQIQRTSGGKFRFVISSL